MENHYLKEQIMEQSRHLFLYGYDGEKRRKFLKSLEEDYKPGVHIDTPVAIYVEEIGLPSIKSKEQVDIYRLSTIATEYLSFSIAHSILQEISSVVDEKELKERIQGLLEMMNYSRNRERKEIETPTELLEMLKTAKDFYKDYYSDYVSKGKEKDLSELTIPFLELGMWIESLKEDLEMSSYFGIIVDKQDPIAISSTRAINDLVGRRSNGDISMKVATTPDGWATYYDSTGQMIEAIHDYGMIELDDAHKQYMKTLKSKFYND